ncbi:MAG: mucoidy inhibitor MuiA family protein [Fibrobacter sp.]|nr:mucoidy inhibitor MuiA family protein [Fibrobacter sp.]
MKGSVFFCTCILTAIYSLYAEELVVKTKISSVTVFRDRAQVTRTFTGELSEGEKDLIFDNLPENIESQSVIVNGTGNGELKDIKVRRKEFAGSNDSISSYLNRRKELYQDSILLVEDILKRCSSERQFVENIAAKVTERGAAEQISAPELDKNKWLNMVEFYRNRLESLSSEMRSASKRKQALSDTLALIERRLRDLNRDERSERNQAVVSLTMKKAGKIELDLSYIVYGPSWTPAYEMRVLSDKKVLLMTYKGSLRQSTGEDWKDANVKLSTATPHIGGNQPELTPWYIRIDEPQMDLPVRSKRLSKSAVPAMMNQMMVMDAELEYKKKEITEAAPMVFREAEVESGATAVVFTIPGLNTINSDSEEHTVTIMTTEFPAHFRYSAVPKLSQYAYLKAKVKNTTSFPLLPGSSSIFLDNSFVSRSEMKLVAPEEEFWTFLGVDEAVKIEYKLINRKRRNEGVIAKKDRIVFEYQINVTNNRKSEEEIVIWDQLPISGSEEIKVELIEPKWKENSSSLKKNEHEFLEWYYKLKAGESVKIPFKFAVEFPNGKNISGL